MSFSIRHRPHKPLCASHSVIHSQTHGQGVREGQDLWLTGEGAVWWFALTHSSMKEWLKQASHTWDGCWSPPGDDVYTDRDVNVCSGQMATNIEKKSPKWFGKVRSMVSSCPTMQWTRRMWLSITPLPPTTFKAPQISPPWKTPLKTPTSPPPLFLFPATLSLPLPTTALLPAPGFCCTNQEQMSAGAVLKDPAVLDASHMLFIQRWRLTARLLVKPISQKKKGWKKQTLQMPSSPFKSSTYMSTPFCFVSAMYCSLVGLH